jgi:hypothetical protein
LIVEGSVKPTLTMYESKQVLADFRIESFDFRHKDYQDNEYLKSCYVHKHNQEFLSRSALKLHTYVLGEKADTQDNECWRLLQCR